jgi:integrase
MEQEGRWIGFSYRDSDGKLHQPCKWRSYAEARAARQEIEVRMSKGEHVTDAKRTYGEVDALWWEAKAPKLRPDSRRGYEGDRRLHILPAFGQRRIQDIDVHDIAGYIADKQRAGLAGSSIDGQLVVIGQVFRYARRRNWATRNPVGELERDERPAKDARKPFALSPDSLTLLLDAFDDLRGYVFYNTVRHSGLRFGECWALRWRNFDFDACEIAVEESRNWKGELGPPKTKAGYRNVMIPHQLAELLNHFRHTIDMRRHVPRDG